MITLQDIKRQMTLDPKNWAIFLMDFVDDFRYYKNPALQYSVQELAMFVYDEPMGPQGEYLTYKILPIKGRL